MNQLAKALKSCKSFKNRRARLTESLDQLSFNYPDLYFLLFKEIKRRELESNDPNRIIKWLSVSQPSNSYMKLHEALMLVKNHNIMAKDEYLDGLKKILCKTIENGTNLEMILKICSLIENSPHLKSIHTCLFHYIEQVKQINENKHFGMETFIKTIKGRHEHEKQTHFDPFNQINDLLFVTQVQPQQHISYRPTGFETFQGFLPFDTFKSTEYNYLEMVSNGSVQLFDLKTIPNITIVSQHMDEAVTKWLQFLKLHKYQWFFKELSYLEIEFIDEDNINAFILKVNRNSITKGAQKKICLSTTTLRVRRQKFKDLLMVLDLEMTVSELCDLVSYMRDILQYPIPNRNCVADDELQQDIVLIMEKSLNHILKKLGTKKVLVPRSLSGSATNKYLECSTLIIDNTMFTKQQIDKILFFVETLRFKIHCMRKNIN